MPNIFDTIEQEAPTSQTGGKRNVFDDIEEEGRNNFSKTAKGTGRGLVRVAVQLGKGSVGAVPAVAAYDIGASVHAPKYLNEKGKEKYKDQPFHKPFQPKLGETEKLNVTSSGLIEKITGVGHPEGFIEKVANWWGFTKNPKKLFDATINIKKAGITPKQVLKSIAPGVDAFSSVGAAAGLQLAEEGQFGPFGTLVASSIGFGLGIGANAVKWAATHPKQVIAGGVNLFTGGNSKKVWTQQLIDDAKKSGIQLDAGTITNSNLIRMLQARASQSALSGKALDNFRQELSGQFMRELGKIYDEVGNLTFENNYQASNAINDFLKQEKDALFPRAAPFSGEPGQVRSLAGRVAVEEQPAYQQEFLNRIAHEEFESSYQAGENLKTAAEDIKNPIREQFNEQWNNFNQQVEVIPIEPQGQLVNTLDRFIESHEGSLLLGESAPESRVLQAAQNLRNELVVNGNELIGVRLGNLIKTKRTLADVADFEFGGSNFQSAYKSLVADVDRAIERTLQNASPELLAEYQTLNAEYSLFKDTFENKNVMPIFEPKNLNYNNIYTSFIKSPDKLRSLEDMMAFTPRGQELVNQLKRDYAQSIIENPNVTTRELRDLENVLGPDFAQDIENFRVAHQYAQEHPIPRIAEQEPIGVRPQALPRTGKPIKGAKESQFHARQKLYEYFQGKSPEQVMKMMDTVGGIKKMRRVLELTSEGKKLFGELSRYKLFEMIDKNMTDNLKENVKLGTFSGLLKSTENKAIALELLGKEGYENLIRLQRNAGRLAASAEKFYNASKSGTTVADIATVSMLMTGIFTGNPFMTMSAASAIGGVKIAGYLLTDKIFLNYLEQAALTSNKEKFLKLLEKMRPSVEKAMQKAALESSRTGEET